MEFDAWKLRIVEKAIAKEKYHSNMSENEALQLSTLFCDYLDDGVLIIKKWRKLKDTTEFTNGDHNEGLLTYISDRHQSRGRELYQGYSSGGVSASMVRSPESRLKSSCKQVI